MNPVRFGIVGMGNIGKQHAGHLLAGRVPRGQLAAICSSSPQKHAEYQARGVTAFSDPASMFHSGAIDAALIATPHSGHLAETLAAFDAGLHVMVEKPIAANKADAEQMLAAHQRHSRLVFAAMFQFRAEPRFQKVRDLLQSGELGQIVRINWISTDWFRTHAYYASGGWRATWAGEGGGVLLNQALHHLDTLIWLCGAPKRLRAFCGLGRFHPVEVEDDVTAWLEWANGATGTFTCSTGEAPGTNRLEITGTRGRLVLDNHRLTVTRNAADMFEFSRAAKEGFVKPQSTIEETTFADATAPHAVILQNFVEAILDQKPLLAPAAEGIHSVELANALTYSSLTDKTVDLPLASAVWTSKLQELIASSKHSK